MNSMNIRARAHRTLVAGFSLVEMLVAVAIFAIISSVILANYPEFRGRAALDNTAHQIALVFREAQVYGISVRGQTNSFPVYGVHVGVRPLTELIIFGDQNNDNMYTLNEKLDTFTLASGEKIVQVCTNVNANQFVAGQITGECVVGIRSGTFNVIFKRPNPDAIFIEQQRSGTEVEGVSNVALQIENRSGSYKRAVQITSTGQIVVK